MFGLPCLPSVPVTNFILITDFVLMSNRFNVILYRQMTHKCTKTYATTHTHTHARARAIQIFIEMITFLEKFVTVNHIHTQAHIHERAIQKFMIMTTFLEWFPICLTWWLRQLLISCFSSSVRDRNTLDWTRYWSSRSRARPIILVKQDIDRQGPELDK